MCYSNIDGKTPLIIACDTSVELYEMSLCPSRPSPSVYAITLLVEASPESVVLEDIDDIGLEYAILSECNMNEIKCLQKACQTVMRKSQTLRSISR